MMAYNAIGVEESLFQLFSLPMQFALLALHKHAFCWKPVKPQVYGKKKNWLFT